MAYSSIPLPSTKCNGFTLLELSVVLVILAVIAGGILSGGSLLRAAELRSVTSELQHYATSTQHFLNQYGGLPGDVRNAQQIFPDIPANYTGNGDRVIDDAPSAGAIGEALLFWYHLATADLIEGQYSGLAGGGGTDHAVIAVNVPKSDMDNSGWSADYSFQTGGSSNVDTSVNYDIFYGHHFVFGAETAGQETQAPALTPQEARSIDNKLDDGVANEGNVIGIHHNFTCATNAGVYNVATEMTLCGLRFKGLF